MGVHLRKLREREIEENHLTQQPPQLLINTYFCYDEKSRTKNDKEKKPHFLQYTENYKNSRETSCIEKKVSIAAIFMAPPEGEGQQKNISYSR